MAKGPRGLKHTPETIAKLKERRKGRKPNLGRKHTKETLAKMAAILVKYILNQPGESRVYQS